LTNGRWCGLAGSGERNRHDESDATGGWNKTGKLHVLMSVEELRLGRAAGMTRQRMAGAENISLMAVVIKPAPGAKSRDRERSRGTGDSVAEPRA
jgi:hypothetical protein